MNTPLDNLRIITWIRAEDYPLLHTTLQQLGCSIFELDGQRITDFPSFFSQARSSLPQDPPLGPYPQWDAFSDSLWGGLLALNSALAVVIWRDVDRMFEGGIPDLFIALECFQDVARGIAQKAPGSTDDLSLNVFLLGKGANFRPLSYWLPELDEE